MRLGSKEASTSTKQVGRYYIILFMRILIIYLFIYSFIIHACSTSKGKSKDSKWENNKSNLYCIKDSNSAISIAKTVLIEKIGEESIKNEVFKAELINDTVWQIKNMDPKKMKTEVSKQLH